jgi:uncharacterized protein with FMN-binding domain
MKKFKIIVLFIVLCMIFTACRTKTNSNANNNANITGTITPTLPPAPTTPPNNNPDNSITGNSVTGGKYKDGIYDVKHKSTKPGYEEAIVTIQNGKIQNIELKRLDDNSQEVNYDQWNGTTDYPNLKQDRLDLASAILAKQSPDVDTISGATQSSNGWIAAVTDALKQAE